MTKYAETKALLRATASDVAQFFMDQIILRHGGTSCVITYRRTAFTAQLIHDVFKLSYTSHRKTTAYHSQSNSLREPFNKIIADMLFLYVDVLHKTWDQVLPYVTFAYNIAVQETTRFTPLRLAYAREVKTTLDSMLPHNCDALITPDAVQLTQYAKEARQLAGLLITHQQSKDACRYNAPHRQVHYHPGDKVWAWTAVRRQGSSENCSVATLDRTKCCDG